MATPDCSAGEVTWYVAWCLWPGCTYQIACHTLSEARDCGLEHHIWHRDHEPPADLWMPSFSVHMETHRWRRLMVC